MALKYKAADADCAGDPATDTGADAVPGQLLGVAAGQGLADTGGQLMPGVGSWRICAWLVDDVSGAVTTQGSTVVRVLPYSGSLAVWVQRQAKRFQVTLTYATSAPGRLYATVQPAAMPCAQDPAKAPKGSLRLVARSGRSVGSDGGLGRSVDASQLTPGRWCVCAWLQADGGAVGPVTKRFAVPKRHRHGARADG